MIKSKELQNIINIRDAVVFDFEKISKSIFASPRLERKGIWFFAGYLNCSVECESCYWCKGRMKFIQDKKSFSECLIYLLPDGRFSPVKLIKLDFHLENELFEI